MSKNLKDIIDLNKYPIHDLNSPKIKSIIEKCKSDLEQDSCSTLFYLFRKNGVQWVLQIRELRIR